MKEGEDIKNFDPIEAQQQRDNIKALEEAADPYKRIAALEAELSRLRKVDEAAAWYIEAGDNHAKQFSLRETDWNLPELLRLEGEVNKAWARLQREVKESNNG